MNTPISIVTVYYNRRDAVARSVQSLLDQTRLDCEIIAVDDGSTDGTREALREIRDPRLRVLALENGGFTAAICAGIEAAGGAYIAIHGSGDLSLPTRIERQAALLDQSPGVVVVGCHVRNALPGGRFERFTPPNGLDFTRALLVRNLFTHGEVMFRRAAYDACGGYRRFFRFAQDIDLWLRMSRLGDYRIVEDVLYQRERRADGVGSSPDRFLLQQKYAEFARQCHEAVLAGEQDLLERHGSAALSSMRRSPRLARTLAVAGASQMVNESVENGWQLVRASLDEAITPLGLTSYVVLSTHRWPAFFRAVTIPAIKKLRHIR